MGFDTRLSTCGNNGLAFGLGLGLHSSVVNPSDFLRESDGGHKVTIDVIIVRPPISPLATTADSLTVALLLDLGEDSERRQFAGLHENFYRPVPLSTLNAHPPYTFCYSSSHNACLRALNRASLRGKADHYFA